MRSDDDDVQMEILVDWKIGRLEKKKPGRRERGGCEKENRRSSGREAGLALSRVERPIRLFDLEDEDDGVLLRLGI